MKLSEECIGKKVRMLDDPPDYWVEFLYLLPNNDFIGVDSKNETVVWWLKDESEWEYYKEPEKLVKKVMYLPIMKSLLSENTFMLDNLLLEDKEGILDLSYPTKSGNKESECIGYCELTVHIKEGE